MTDDSAKKDRIAATAIRALAEAEARRAAAPCSGPDATRPPELGGRKGADPIRYGDWEKGGLAIDF